MIKEMEMRFGSILITLPLAILVALLLINPTFITGAIILGIILLPIFWIHPKWFFVFFLITRPLLDISIESFQIRTGFSALFVFLLIFLSAKEIVLNKNAMRHIFSDPYLKSFNILFSIFIVFSLFSFRNTDNKLASLSDFIRMFSLPVAVNYVVIFFPEWKKDLKKYFNVLLGAAAIPMFLGLYQFIMHKGISSGGYNRIYGTFAHCNVYAEFLALIIFAIVFLFNYQVINRKHKVMLWLLLIISLFSLYLTYTRTVWIAVALASVFYIAFVRGLKRKTVYLFLTIVFIVGLSPKISQRFENVIYPSYLHGGSSWQWRIDLWQDRLRDVKQHLWDGHGLGMFQESAGVMAHNDFLRLSYEVGIIGANIFYGLIFLLLFQAFKLSRKSDQQMKTRGLIAFCLTLILIVSSMSINTLRSTIIMFYYLVTISLLLVSDRYTTIEQK